MTLSHIDYLIQSHHRALQLIGLAALLLMVGVLYAFGPVWWTKWLNQEDMRQFLNKIGASKTVHRKRTGLGPDGKPVTTSEPAEVYAKWRYVTRWSRRYHREVVGVLINTRGFAVDTDELAAKKKALQDACDLLLAAEGPQAAGRNRISWRGLLIKKN